METDYIFVRVFMLIQNNQGYGDALTCTSGKYHIYKFNLGRTSLNWEIDRFGKIKRLFKHCTSGRLVIRGEKSNEFVFFLQASVVKVWG